MVDLTTTYLGMKLHTPLVPSASPLSETIENVRRMQDAGAAAVVFHSLFEEQIEDTAPNCRVDPKTYLKHISEAKRSVTIPIIELVGGALVIIGLRTREALIALGAILVLVTFGHLLKEPLYQFHTHVIPRLALLLFILMLPREDDRFSLDHMIARRREQRSS